MQAGRGGRNPEIRTLFYRLLKFLALPVHPLFVYDGKNKPPFKRGKAVGQRNAPIIQLSKHLIDLFKFPRHEAPGEAEAECANLQRAGIVDAVMSNDADAMMFGSTMTVMNFSKESGSGSGSASHVTCYRMGGKADPSKVGIDRAGMVLFAMLSGGDYLPSGVPKCGSKVAAEIAKAGFGSDLLEAIGSKGTERMQQLSEWRERLQYELEENESGYFQTKHKAVRIPQNFPDQTILEYYASPAESNAEELRSLRHRLANAWDQDIDPSQIRDFAARFFDWNYRSGARKVIRLLAEPLVTYRLRLQKQPSVFPLNGPSLSNSEVPMLQKVYRTRASYSTDGLPELQLDFIPIDIVGLDLFAEEPNPPLPSQETAASGDEEEGLDIPEESGPQSPVKKRVTKRYDPYAPEKIWIFETLARIGIPAVVEKWEKERAEKAAPKKPSTRKTGPRKKGPIDPGMKRGSILKYGIVTKERPQVSQFKQTHLFDAAVSTTPTQSSNVSGARGLERSPSTMMDTPKRDAANVAGNLDDVIEVLSSCSISPELGVKRHPMVNRHRPETRRRAICSGGTVAEDLEASNTELTLVTPSPPQALPRGLKISYSNASYTDLDLSELERRIALPPSPTQRPRRQARKKTQAVTQEPREVKKLEDAVSSLSLLKPDSGPGPDTHPGAPADCSRFTTPKRRSPKKKTNEIPTVDLISSKQQTKTKKQIKPAVPPIEEDLPAVQNSLTKKTEEMNAATEERAKKAAHQSSNPNSSKLSTLDAPPKDPSPKPQLPKDTQYRNQHETSGHVESITIHDDGSWTVDKFTPKEKKKKNEMKASTVDPSNQRPPKPENSDTESSRKDRRGETNKKKKRVSRVSILDLT